jgi:hypothetical protein
MRQSFERFGFPCVALLAVSLTGACGGGEDNPAPPQPQAPVDDAGGPDAGADQVGAESALEAGADSPGQDSGPEGSAGSDGSGGADGGDGGGFVPCTEAPRELLTYDLSVMPPKTTTVKASCRGIGDHALLYVADDIWGKSIGQKEADQVMTAWERATPADPTKGIWQLVTGTFGPTTDVDKDGRVLLLYYEIKGYAGYQFDGFIRREDMLGGIDGNKAEVLYIDGVRNPPGGEYMLGVAAHEFQHMVHLAHDTDEDGWLDETLSEASMVVCGYLGDLKEFVAKDFSKNPTQSLTTEPPKFNYGAGFLFGAYLHRRFGEGFLRSMVAEPTNGIAGLDKTLKATGKPDSFRTLLRDWAAANFLDAPTIDDGRFGYTAFDVPAMAATVLNAPTSGVSKTLEPHSARYFVFQIASPAGSSVKVALQSAEFAGLEVRHAAYPDADKSKATVGLFSPQAASSELTVSGVGGAIDRVLVAVVETAGAAATVQVSATVP